MSINALSIANAILDEAERQGVSVTPMQLQKLLYFTNGWHMELNNGQPIVSDNFKAWQFGPVLPVAYHEFKRFGSNPITGRAMNPFAGEAWEVVLKPNQKSLIAEIVSIYGALSGAQMSNITHMPNTPWSKTWNSGVGSGDDISPDIIHAEFSRLRNERTARAG